VLIPAVCPECHRPIEVERYPDGPDLTDMHPVGAVVKLAAGDGRMTVVERIGSEARIAWLDDTGKPHELTVDVRALDAVVCSKCGHTFAGGTHDPDGKGCDVIVERELETMPVQVVKERCGCKERRP
jgi:ribosomal protein L37AE/L43A